MFLSSHQQQLKIRGEGIRECVHYRSDTEVDVIDQIMQLH